jgi:hypothetical protein
MLKGITREIGLAIQAKTAMNMAVVVWMAVMALAALMAFVFLCVSGYDWLSQRFGNVTAGLAMTGIFLLIAIAAAIASALIRRQVRQRAILARAARAHAPSWLLDPRVLNAAVQVGRSAGWQRIVPIAVVGFMVAQWAREYRNHGKQDSDF